MISIKGYYLITDSDLSLSGNRSDVSDAVAAGVKIIQYRNKTGHTKSMLEEALELREICRGKSIFIIDDRMDIALACDADGMHIGQDDMPLDGARKFLGRDRVIGVTVHSWEDAEKALEGGADYIAVSPVFSTLTKLDAGKPLGLSLIEKLKKTVTIPVVAIGGITLRNARSVIKAGADAVCAISAVVAKENVKDEIMKFQKLFV